MIYRSRNVCKTNRNNLAISARGHLLLKNDPQTQECHYYCALLGHFKDEVIETDNQHFVWTYRGCNDGRMKSWLHSLTNLASTNVFAHEIRLASSLKVVTDRKISLRTVAVPTCWCIVAFKHDRSPEIMLERYDGTTHVTIDDCVTQ